MRRPLLGAAAAVAAVVATGGVAVASAHSDGLRAQPLPARCVDGSGLAGGGLAAGAPADGGLGNILRDGSSGISKLLEQGGAGGGDGGAGTPAQQQAQARALVQGGGGGATGGGQAGSSGTTPRQQQPAVGYEEGGGGGSAGGGGASGGSGSGPVRGPGGGTGTQVLPGDGADGTGAVTTTPPPKRVTPPVRATARPRTRHGLPPVALGLLLLALAALGVLVLRRLLRRRVPAVAPTAVAGMSADDADALAARAAAAADHDTALRWTFVAGLLRLDRAGVLPYDPCRPTARVARRLARAGRGAQRGFTELAGGFDAVAYGGRHASAGDVRQARAGWDALLAAVRS